jgi:hypothetical protein
MIGPVAPEGEVYHKYKHEHEELEAFPYLTDLGNFLRIHILQEEDASKNRKVRCKLP